MQTRDHATPDTVDPRAASDAVALILALGSALTFGVADFLGGLASRRVATWTVVVGSQLAGLCLLVVILPVLPPADFDRADLAWGAAAGLVGAAGLSQFFRALSTGNMSVVAPIAAVITGGVPTIAGVALGERPSPLSWLGIVVALPAIALIAREAPTGAQMRTPRPALVAAAVAGLGFGTFYVLVDRTADTAGIQPLIAARMTSVTAMLLIGGIGGRLARPGRDTVVPIAVSGALDMTANVLFLYAVREGLLALGSVVSAMYPASTIVLARVVLGERLARAQVAGLAAAGVAVALVALG